MNTPIQDVVLPQLGMGMAEGSIVEWLVAEGAQVSRDQPLVSIETEKVVTELPAPASGIVHLVARPGDKVPVETVIARIAPSDEAYRALLAGTPSANGTSQRTQGPGSSGSPLGDSVSASAGHGRVVASGAAKALARQNAVDLATVVGTGPGGRIVESDVLRQIEKRPPTVGPDSRAGNLRLTIPLAGVRRAIAERMVRSSTQAAQTFVFFEIDITDLLRVRAGMLEQIADRGTKLPLLAFYAKAVALACKRVPIANATLEGNEICLWNDVNIGIAVALPGSTELDSSLIVPVVHGANYLEILELNERIQQQVKKAREGMLAPSDLSGGTITISSTAGFTAAGVWGISAPLLNLPQVINFQPGTAIKRPLVIEDQIAIRSVLPCGLTFDHRCLDGEPAGRFIKELCGFLGQPETMLV